MSCFRLEPLGGKVNLSQLSTKWQMSYSFLRFLFKISSDSIPVRKRSHFCIDLTHCQGFEGCVFSFFWQALAKQFAEILHFTLTFDDLKVRVYMCICWGHIRHLLHVCSYYWHPVQVLQVCVTISADMWHVVPLIIVARNESLNLLSTLHCYSDCWEIFSD